MAYYAVGDVQGCFGELQNLLNRIDFNYGKDTLWLTGDIVNRGPQSLETLRFVKQHDTCMQTVLGNHDLHLMAVAFAGAKLKKNDTITPILEADDSASLLHWLRHQPMMVKRSSYLMVHAGLLPEWDANFALSLAGEVESAIQAADFRHVFLKMYGNKPDQWDNRLEGMDRLRMIMNVMTRMRVISPSGKLDFDFKSTYDRIPKNLMAWFDAKKRQYTDHTVIFGHWSALGLYQKRSVIGLDTGALWGGELTAINLDTGEIVQEPSSGKGLPID